MKKCAEKSNIGAKKVRKLQARKHSQMPEAENKVLIFWVIFMGICNSLRTIYYQYFLLFWRLSSFFSQNCVGLIAIQPFDDLIAYFIDLEFPFSFFLIIFRNIHPNDWARLGTRWQKIYRHLHNVIVKIHQGGYWFLNISNPEYIRSIIWIYTVNGWLIFRGLSFLTLKLRHWHIINCTSK